jgi:hypothetical protein
MSSLCLTVLGIGIAVVVWADPPASPEKADGGAARAALERLNPLIGGWRGIAQPRRGSTRDAWQQTGEWIWDFSNDASALRYEVAGGKLEKSARLSFDPPTARYTLELTSPKGEVRQYAGIFDEQGRLVLQSEPDAEHFVHRVTITLLNEDRTLVLHERRLQDQAAFQRLAEVGYTRQGVRLAVPGSGQPECIVTGGAGTIPVQFEGKTYYVCCTGCQQAFEADPQGILREAAERRAAARSQPTR